MTSHAFLAISPQELNEIKDQIQDVEGRYMQGLKEMKVPVCGVCAPHTNPTALRETCKPHAYSNEAPAGSRTAGGGSAGWRECARFGSPAQLWSQDHTLRLLQESCYHVSRCVLSSLPWLKTGFPFPHPSVPDTFWFLVFSAFHCGYTHTASLRLLLQVSDVVY